MGVVTHRRVIAEVVDHAMDARALNLDQSELLHNPATPEVDSYLEFVASLKERGIPGDVITELERYGWMIVELNGREGSFARMVAGNGEQIARELKHVDGRQSLKRPALRRRLRPILDVLADPGADPMAYVRAGRDLHLLQREVPIETLLSKSLAHEIGRDAELLHRYLRDDAREPGETA